MNRLLIKNASQLLTMNTEDAGDVGLIENGCIYIENGKIAAIGSVEDVQHFMVLENIEVIDASSKIVLPGFVDCHTHLVFGGSRVKEYSVKLTDESPETLKKLGIEPGLYGTVNATDSLADDDLEKQSLKRLTSMILTGTTTIEIKSGYGLTTESEIRMLRVNERLEKKLPLDIYSTFLGAHYWPKDLNKEKYIDILINEMIPRVSELKIAKYSDIWCDDGYYTAKECEKVLSCARDYGMSPRIHTDAYSYIGGSDLAADMSMLSADHLNYTPEKVFKKLRDANVIGVVLPGTDFAVKHPRPFNPRPMLNSGMKLALASNCNPGVWVESMQFILALACRNHGFTPAEAIKSSTLFGAMALGLYDRGVLDVGKKADIQIWNLDTYEDVVYKFGTNHVETVIKDGEIIVDKGIIKGAII
ncbi:MAG: imidazolonepropionase [Sedimentibacter sp.]